MYTMELRVFFCIFLSTVHWETSVAGPTTGDASVHETDSAVFKYHGQAAMAVGYAHVSMEFDVVDLVFTHEAIFRGLQKGEYSLKAYKELRSDAQTNPAIMLHGTWLQRTKVDWEANSHALEGVLHDLGIDKATLTSHLKIQEADKLRDVAARHHLHRMSRERRQVGAIAAGVFAWIGGSLWGHYSSDDITDVQKAARRNQEDISRMGTFIARNAMDIGRLENETAKLFAALKEEHLGQDFLDFTEAMDFALARETRIIRDLALMVQDLRHGIFNAALVDRKEVNQAYEEVRQKATKAGFHLLTGTAADLVQCKADFAVRGTTVQTVVRVPMAKDEDIVDVHEYVPIPIRLSGGDSIYVTVNLGATVFIGRTHGAQFRALTHDQLQDCSRVHGYLVCPEISAARLTAQLGDEKSDEACLWGLMTENFPVIKKACTFRLRPAIPMLITLGGNQFMGFGHEETLGQITCDDHRYNRNLQVDGRFAFALRPGCTANTGSHVATAMTTIESQVVKSKAWTWHRDLEDLFSMPLEDLQRVATEHRGVVADSGASIEAIRAWHEERTKQIQNVQLHKRMLWGTMAAVTAGVLIALTAGCIFWKKPEVFKDCLRRGTSGPPGGAPALPRRSSARRTPTRRPSTSTMYENTARQMNNTRSTRIDDDSEMEEMEMK